MKKKMTKSKIITAIKYFELMSKENYKDEIAELKLLLEKKEYAK